MVRDSLGDGKRIAELLSSECTGLETGPLAAVAVTDADPDVEPTADGATAYRITHDGSQVATVSVTPSVALVGFEDSVVASTDLQSLVADGRHPDLSLAGGASATLRVESGAGVKAAVDVLRAVLSADGTG
ncbi:hypothetical protein ACKVMT_14440 [Halobacteriales archaeon Cl-PHB]